MKVNKNEIPVISTKDGYSIEPSPDVLRMLLEEKGEKALAQIEDFVVTRKNFGSVRWLEPVDVRGLKSIALFVLKGVSYMCTMKILVSRALRLEKVSKSALK